MNDACKDHVADMGPTGAIGNKGTDDSQPPARVDKYGLATKVDQSMGYSSVSGLDFILKLLIDDGNDQRQNRYNLLNPEFLHAGTYSGTHKDKGHQLCLTFAATYTPNVDDTKVVLDNTQYRQLDLAVYNAINSLREDPKSFVPKLEALLPRFNGKTYKEPGKFAIETQEGVDPVKEVIFYLNKAPTKTRRLADEWKDTPTLGRKLFAKSGMADACKDHVNDMGPPGAYGSIGQDGSTITKRLNRYAFPSAPLNQNNLYSKLTADDIVLWMLISDGDATRSNRYNMLNPGHWNTGIYSGPHSKSGHQICLAYAGFAYIQNVDQTKKVLTGAEYRTIDIEILTEINKIRVNPKSILPTLKLRVDWYDGKMYKQIGFVGYETQEGVAALNELIAYIEKAPDVPATRRRLQDEWKTTPVIADAFINQTGMALACEEYVLDQASTGDTTADGRTSAQRVDKYGLATGVLQNVNTRRITGLDAVIDMLINDGDATRALRYNIMNPNLKHIGISSAKYDTVGLGHRSCIKFAESYTDNIDDAKVAQTEEQYRALDAALLTEINALRANPSSFRTQLEGLLQYFNGNIYKVPGRFAVTTQEGATAVNDAISYLQTNSQTRTALTLKDGITNACKDHVNDLFTTGATGSTGTDGSTEVKRIDKYALVTSPYQSNNYGKITAKDIVIAMLIDDGVSSRANRLALMSTDNVNFGTYNRDHPNKGHQNCAAFTFTYTDNIVEKDKTLTTAEYRTLDTEFFAELNKLRQNPKSFVPILTARLAFFDDKSFKKPGVFAYDTVEGAVAVQDAIDYLNKAPDVPALRRRLQDWKTDPVIAPAATSVTGLVSACTDHVTDTGPTGVIGNIGTDSSTPVTRAEKYGTYTYNVGQNMAYSRVTGLEMLLDMLVDDGVSTRDNRYNLLDPSFLSAGTFSGTHSGATGRGHQSCLILTGYFYNKVTLTEAQYRQLDTDLLTDINAARNDPSQFDGTNIQTILNGMLANFDGNTYREIGRFEFETTEGQAAVQDAITYVSTFTPASRLNKDPDAWKINPVKFTAPVALETGLTNACRDHVADTGPTGKTGIIGVDGSDPATRVGRYGTYGGTLLGQNSFYRFFTARDYLLWSIIDDGNASNRINRFNIFDPNILKIGIYHGTMPRPLYHQSCAVFADVYTTTARRLLQPIPKPVIEEPESKVVLTFEDPEPVVITQNFTQHHRQLVDNLGVIVPNPDFRLRIKMPSGLSYDCKELSKCVFQLTGTNMPTITSAAVDAATDKITITGTSLDKSFYTKQKVSVTFGGVEADSVTVASATSIEAVWSSAGIPIVDTASDAVLKFKSEDTKDFVNPIQSTPQGLKNELAIKSITPTTEVDCSYAGGCSVTLDSPGLFYLLQDQTKNYIEICGTKAEINIAKDKPSKSIEFQLPFLSTTVSNEQFKIQEPTPNMKIDKAIGSALFAANAFNGNLLDDTGPDLLDEAFGQCYLGMAFREGYVGILNRMKFFIYKMEDKSAYETLSFQGSNDNENYDQLFKVDFTVHEGWNYFEFEKDKLPAYRYYRFKGTKKGACKINEISFTGVEAIKTTNADESCVPKLFVNEKVTTLLDAYKANFKSALTPLITKVSPKFGPVTGGTKVTITGTGFLADATKAKVTIDGFDCVVDAVISETEMTCVTGKRPGLPKESFKVFFEGKGLASNAGNKFRYVSFWSDETTWGNEKAPLEMESVYVPPGLNLLVDIDKTPKLNAVIVEGSIIFAPHETDPTHKRTFDAHYIFIRNGTMTVGTEAEPYTSKITITMHGTQSSPYIPIYGNKAIGVRFGTLDMHGPVRTPTWTVLAETAEAGATTIKLNTSVDWVAGERISIASTSFESREAEEREIKSIDNTVAANPVITLDSPLVYKHFAADETFGTETISMRAEVGLLSRSVVFRGDPESSPANQYGAAIFIHSQGDDSVIARFGHIELNNTGQAFKVGRYSIHFHMIGAVYSSYVKGVSVHEAFNRAVTLHGTNYLRIEDNVIYDVKGHNIFIEDAVEQNNYIKNNLVMMTKRSWSLLNTDQSPACFWITHPNNIFIGNHAAGSDRYGYWYDLQVHGIGPSANQNICPENDRVGEFTDNHAHSMGRYGLRIFHNMVPRTKPCSKIVRDSTNPPEQWANAPLKTQMKNLVSWKNNRNGAIAEMIGYVQFINFKTADNLLAGIEISKLDGVVDNMAIIQGGIVVGKTSNTDAQLDASSPHGIITPRSEYLTIDGVQFFNFNFNDAAALGTCSHCFHPASTDSGARTITVKKLAFTDVTKRIRYQYPKRAIFYDEDGTLTGLKPKTWAAPFYEHMDQPECKKDLDVYDGVICDDSVQIRRIAFHNYKGPLDGQGMKILKWDDDVLEPFVTKRILDQYTGNKTLYSTMIFKKGGDLGQGWAVPFVTGHKYKFHFGQTGIDFTEMQISLSERWLETDKPVYLVHNFTDQREFFSVMVDDDKENIIKNNTITRLDQTLGQNLVKNDTETREFDIIISGKTTKVLTPGEHKINIKAFRCLGGCPGDEGTGDGVPVEEQGRFWSKPDSWPNKKVPVAGEEVVIDAGVNMIFDLQESPIFKMITIDGKLTFKQNAIRLHLRANHIYIRSGELEIGTEEQPFQNDAMIELYGKKNDATITYTNAIEAGSKILANVGTLKIFGRPRQQLMTRLTKEALRGSDTIFVEKDLELYPGERIAILASSYEGGATDYRTVESYDRRNGELKLNTVLTYYHWGAATSNALEYNGVDMRSEVLILSRNVKIEGQNIESWGAQIVTSDVIVAKSDGTIAKRQGQTIMKNVEIYNCSQIDTEKAAIRFEGAASAKVSQIVNASIHNGLGWGIHVKNSANIELQNNQVYNFRPVGVAFEGVRNVQFDGNVVANIVKRTTLESGDQFVDKSGGVCACSLKGTVQCSNLTISNNIVAGSQLSGYVALASKCGEQSKKFYNNIAHSVNGVGAIIIPDKWDPSQKECFEASFFKAYKNTEQGANTVEIGQNIKFHHMTMIDNAKGFSLNVANKQQEYSGKLKLEAYQNKFYGETASPDCPTNGGFCFKQDKFAVMATFVGSGSNDPHPTSASGLPYSQAMSNGGWEANVTYTNNEFHNFAAKTAQGKRQVIFALNPLAADYIPSQYIWYSLFDKVDVDAFMYLKDPNPSWANPTDCGDFPCTAPHNMIYHFHFAKFQGDALSKTQILKRDAEFQYIPNNPNFSPYITGCNFEASSNAFRCNNDFIAELMFESEDADKLDRSMQPIYVQDVNKEEINIKLNAMMDHVWDGFYTGQKRLQRFPSLILAQQGEYFIHHTGTPARKMKFSLRSDNSKAGVVLRIPFPSAESRRILLDGQEVPFNKWDDTLRNYGPFLNATCGENRYIGVKNILEFYITAGCTLQIEPKKVIQSLVRMDWSLDAFFSQGGTTTFIDKIAGSLGIDTSTIKIVSVYEGSLVVNYGISAPGGDDSKLEQIKKTQNDAFATGAIDVGAPILDVQVSIPPTDGAATAAPAAPESIVSDGIVSAAGYEPKVLTLTATNLEKAKAVAAASNDPTVQLPTTSTTTTPSDKVDPSFNINLCYTKPDGTTACGDKSSTLPTINPLPQPEPQPQPEPIPEEQEPPPPAPTPPPDNESTPPPPPTDQDPNQGSETTRENTIVPKTTIKNEEVPEEISVTLWLAFAFVLILCCVWVAWSIFNKNKVSGPESHGGTLASDRLTSKKANETMRGEQSRYLEVVDGEMLQINNQKQVDASEEIRRLSEIVDSSDSDEFDYDSGDRKKTGDVQDGPQKSSDEKIIIS